MPFPEITMMPLHLLDRHPSALENQFFLLLGYLLELVYDLAPSRSEMIHELLRKLLFLQRTSYTPSFFRPIPGPRYSLPSNVHEHVKQHEVDQQR